MISPMVLHWGEVTQNITVTGVRPASGNISRATASRTPATRAGSGSIGGVSGSGGAGSVSGSGGG